MAPNVTIDLRHVARGTNVPLRQVQAVVELLDDGNTVPFITRYRKDQTGGLDEEQIRQIQSRLAKERQLAERKQTILRSIESQGKLTEELGQQILGAGTMKRLEDLYLPLRPKKRTLATLARERGLEPFAHEILHAAPAAADLDARAADFINPDRDVTSGADALLGAGHILAEQFSENIELRQKLRDILHRTGSIRSIGIATEPKPADEKSAEQKPAKPQADSPVSEPQADSSVSEASENAGQARPLNAPQADSSVSEAPKPAAKKKKAKLTKKERKEQKRKKQEEQRIKAFRDYFDFAELLRKIPPHRVLAINRGEKANVLKVKIEVDTEAMFRAADEHLVATDHPHADYLRGCARDTLTRLIVPALEREARRELTDRAETHAIDVFAKNLRNLLLQPPVRGRRVLAVDPAFRTGCKLAALDQFGNVLEHGVIYLIGRAERRKQSADKVIDMVRRYGLSVIAVGNGTACRETEEFVAGLIADGLKDDSVEYVIVNEAGASVYSTSRIGREEFPNYDASLRGAVSIGRRLLDPLSELVKIDPANIGVGLYQHDVKGKHLRSSLDDVVESCVNYVGVDVNTASPALLGYVSGMNQLTARRVYEHRMRNGPFRNREQLRDVPGFGDATFVQAAGFLKIAHSVNPLDATWIHPESYDTAGQVLQLLGGEPHDLRLGSGTERLAAKVSEIDVEAKAAELGIGTLLLRDILAQLTRPGRDPREDLPAPIFKRDVLKFEDLEPNMALTGTVLNVVDFGCFVDIGMHDSGLIHVSQLANRFVQDPHDVVAVGDIVHVWVMQVDKERRRVSLTMVDPNAQRASRERRGRGRGRNRPATPQGEQAQAGSSQAGATQQGEKPTGQKSGPPRRRERGGRDRQRSGGGRPPGKGGRGRGRDRGGPPRERGPYETKPKGPPPPPLSEDMKAGKEPMRTFGDLMQFYQEKETEEEKPEQKPEANQEDPETKSDD